MLVPTKYENIDTNTLVTGSVVLAVLTKELKDIENLFQKTKEINGVDLNEFYDTITFLWLADFICVQGNVVEINKV